MHNLVCCNLSNFEMFTNAMNQEVSADIAWQFLVANSLLSWGLFWHCKQLVQFALENLVSVIHICMYCFCYFCCFVILHCNISITFIFRRRKICFGGKELSYPFFWCTSNYIHLSVSSSPQSFVCNVMEGAYALLVAWAFCSCRVKGILSRQIEIKTIWFPKGHAVRS